MRRRLRHDDDTDVPPGWTRLLPTDSSWNSAHPVAPSSLSAGRQPAGQNRKRLVQHDALGLSKALAPVRLLQRELRVREQLQAVASSAPMAAAAAIAAARSSPRHWRLIKQQQQQQQQSEAPVSSDDRDDRDDRAAAEAFSPLRSLRLARLRRRPPAASGLDTVTPTAPLELRAVSPTECQLQARRSREAPDLPLHELIQTADSAVAADPFVDSSQAAITHAFMAQWLARFDASRQLYKSVEVGFQELYRLTANVSSPNELATAFACRVLRDLAPHFGAYAPLVEVLRAELHLSAYSLASSPPLPYFAIVKNQKQLVLALRRDKTRRRERNEFLVREIAKVHHMFLHFLDECSAGLVRTLFREWYSIAVVRKKNSKKYIEYFSMWFTGSAKALVPKLFMTWKHEAVQRKMDRMQAQLNVDAENLAALQRQIDDLALQRDVAQLESLAMRNDRKQAEDMIQRFNRKVESAGSYLEGSYRREGLVCVEGQLRAEAVSFLPPLVLESLLRGFHNVGFLQQTFAVQFQLIQKRMDAKNLHVIFTGGLPAVRLPRDELTDSITEGIEDGGGGNGKEGEDAAGSDHDSPAHTLRIAEKIARVYEHTIRTIRAQDEHYARNAKLFSSRILESHEVSVVPTHFVARSNALLAAAATPITTVVGAESLGQGGLTPADAMVAFESGDLGVINGARRYSKANVCPVKLTALQRLKPSLQTAPIDASQASWVSAASVPSDAALDQIELIQRSDFDLSARHSRAFFMVFLSHLVSEFGSLLFSPADMSPFMHNAYIRESSTPAAATLNAVAVADKTTPTTSQSLDQGFHDIVLAYEVWNRLAGQMIEADIVQNRGGAPDLAEAAARRVSTPGAAARRASTPGGVGLPIRPKLQFHIEPLPHGILMTCAKEKEATGSGGSSAQPRPSLSVGETFHSARIRRLSINDAVALTQCVDNIHCVVKATATRLQDFTVVRRQIGELRQLQWEQASELASQFASSSSSSSSSSPQATAFGASAPASTDPVFSTSRLVDERKHVFECVSFDNPVIDRIFSVEESPSDELERVRAVLERKKHLVRHLYTKFRPQIQHAVSLDDLWHFVKVLRFPKEVHMLPAMRDEDAAASGFEQLFSPDDLAEILLHLCNEQFLPQLTPISARVEYFVLHHLPFAAQNQSIIRDVMHQLDVKRALADHSQTIRIIFRRYCAKERELGLAHSQQHHGGVGAAATVGKSGQQQQQQHRSVRHAGHGIAKYMRLIDWLAFIQDYNLLRPRFPLDNAVTVFRNVQEVASSGSAGDGTAAVAALDEQRLEMIYSEFCEALVSVAACYFPDPFLKSATKVSQFVQRFLPVSPEEVCSHAKV